MSDTSGCEGNLTPPDILDAATEMTQPFTSKVVSSKITSLITVVHCLESRSNNAIIDDNVKTIFGKYLKNVPDIESRYVLNDKLSSVINHYFKGKISSMPLFKISLNIDRNPVKIPWTFDTIEKQKVDTDNRRNESIEQQDKIDKPGKVYKVVKASDLFSSTKKPTRST